MLEMQNITVGYGKKTVLHDLSLALNRGELLAVVGPNACGKSTLVRTVAGLLSPVAGKVTLEGEDVTLLPRNTVARRVSYLAQSRNVPDMTVEQLVLHGRFPYLHYPRVYSPSDRAIAQSSIAAMGLEGCAHLPLHTLSGGMRQNAYLAMALCQSTDYLLLDEPTTYLDVSHCLSLMRRLEALALEGRGVLAVLHDLPLAFTFAHRIALMSEGQLVALGTPEQLWQGDLPSRVLGVALGRDGDGTYYHKIIN